MASATKGEESAGAKDTGTDGMRQYKNQLAGKIMHTTIHSSRQRGKGK